MEFILKSWQFGSSVWSREKPRHKASFETKEDAEAMLDEWKKHDEQEGGIWEYCIEEVK